MTFVPLDTGTIVIDSVTMPHGVAIEVVGPDAENLPFTWLPTTITVVQGMPTGDVNGNDEINATDIVALVNYLFKGGPPPAVCEACGDVDCSGTVAASDLIALINFVFKGGGTPCNAGDLVDVGVWVCP